MTEPNVFETQTLDPTRCFLCGVPLTNSNRSDEHVFPKWLQRKVGLWDQELLLLNNTSIPYRQLAIPCCMDCNNGPLANLERVVREALTAGYDAARQLHDHLLFQWCGKIFYGVLFKELCVLADRSKPDESGILGPEELNHFFTFHLFLQSIRLPFTFVDFVPYSVFLFETHAYNEPPRNFDFLDMAFVLYPNEGVYRLYPACAIRVADVGLICLFEDHGMQKKFMQAEYGRLHGHPLHPVQFTELAIRAMYKNTTLSYVAHYTSLQDPDSGQVQVMWHRPPPGPVWNDWNDRDYARHFWMALKRHPGSEGIMFSDVYSGDGAVLTFIYRPDRTILRAEKESQFAVPNRGPS